MSPETGNFFKSAAELPVLGGIRMLFLMPPETGNLFNQPLNYPFRVALKCCF